MRRLITVVLTLMLAGWTACAAKSMVADGRTYRITTGDGGKVLFVENASLDENANVVVWTATDVPAEQWTAHVDKRGMVTFRNVYTGLFLTSASGRMTQGAQPTCFALDKGERKGDVCLRTEGRYMTVPDTTDGTQLLMGDSRQAWRLVEVKPQRTFTTAMRNRMADAFLKQYRKTVAPGRFTFTNGGWSESETMEAVLDMYEATHDKRYKSTYEGCYEWFSEHVGQTWNGGTRKPGYDWFGYDFNDDVMWHIIGAARAYNLLGERKYLEDAKRNFKIIYERAYMPYCGLVRWAEKSGDRNGANSCINGPTEVAACYIGIAEADESYFEIARDLYARQREVLFDPATGHVDDAVVFDPTDGSVKSRNSWASTYNQGTMLGAATLLYQHYGDEQYRQDANRIFDFARKNLCNEHGIVKVCQNVDGDFQGFKGILMRYVGLYARVFDSDEAREWLMRNAFHAYNNMNSRHYGHSAWLTKAAEDGRYGDKDYRTCAFGASTALAAGAAGVY